MNGPDQWTIACKRDGCNEMVTGNTEDVLAFIAAQNAKHRPKEQPQLPSLEQAVASLKWTPNKYGEGEWAFSKTREGATTKESEALTSAVLKAGGKLESEGYVYSYDAANPKFISRKKK